MQTRNNVIHFYIAKNRTNQSRYDIYNIYTDTAIREYVTREAVQEFLLNNEPTHPMMNIISPPLSGIKTQNTEEYLKSYQLYYNGYQNPYGVTGLDATKTDAIGVYYAQGTTDFSKFSYVVSDNDVCSNLSNNRDTGDCDSDADSYGDSNHLPYITGRIGHSGD